MAKNKGGRPSVMTEVVIQKLEQAFAMGCTDLEACLYAEISKSTFYDYIKENPEFSDRKDILKEMPVLKARESVIRHMEQDGNLAMKYLERKKKDEFASRSELTGKDGAAITIASILEDIDGSSTGLPED